MSAKSRQQIYLQQYENGLINNKNSSKSKTNELSSATVNVETVNPSEDDGMLIADSSCGMVVSSMHNFIDDCC